MEELVESILDYVRNDYTDYAIMLNGEWGSGKTYFWNHKIKNKIESMHINGKKYTTIYMSLYGISNLEEISKKIFIETTQLMDKNLKRYMQANEQTNIPEYAKTGLDMANFFGVTQNGDNIDYEEFFTTDDKVLCFDDLERANVFDKANDYERIKEKLIGETFEYAPEFNYIINGLLMRYEKNEELIRFLRENTGLIISTFHKSGTRNLRILKHALNDFRRIFEMVNSNYPKTNHRVLQTMLIFTIAISFEIKAGKITKDKFINIKDNEEYKSILVSSRVLLSDNRQFYIKEFDNNYYYNFKAEYRFIKFIEIYVRTRIFDMKVFKENMEVIINTVDTDKLPGYKRLLTEEYWKINDDQFIGVIEEVLDDVKNGRLRLIDIVKLFAYFSYFIKKQLISYDMRTIKSIFFQGMNIASLTSDYCDNVEQELAKITIGEVNTDIEEILKHFNQLNIQLKDKMYIEMADEIFKCIPMRMDIFYERFDKECMNIPIFKYCDAFQMFQRISCASNEDIVTIKEKLANRVKLYQVEIQPEIKNIQQLKHLIDDYTKNKDTTIKMVILREFSKDLEYILDQYKIAPVQES